MTNFAGFLEGYSMDAEIIIIGGGAAGLMAAIAAAEKLRHGVATGAEEKSLASTIVQGERSGGDSMAVGSGDRSMKEEGGLSLITKVVVIEKMPRVARKMMISGKGRCNFSNAKKWNEFSQHIRSKSNFLRPAFYTLDPQGTIALFEEGGLRSVVERGDRVFPESHLASDVVDTLVRMAKNLGVRIETGCEVKEIVAAGNVSKEIRGVSEGKKIASDRGGYNRIVASEAGKGEDSLEENTETVFIIKTASGEWRSKKVIIATGGLSYPSTGSSGDGYAWARTFGHSIRTTFPSLTAMVPRGYKTEPPEKGGHLDRSVPLSEMGRLLCGVQLRNVGAVLRDGGNVLQEETGDLDFKDGGIEGPIGFRLSRSCVWSVINGGRPVVTLDLKPGVKAQELSERVGRLWDEVRNDPRSRRLSLVQMYRILLGKLMPRELIAAFDKYHPEIFARRPLSTEAIAKALKRWEFPIAGYVGYERCVVTAGGVSTDEVFPKTMESRLQRGLYLAGEVLDIDCDTGGYNMQCAFSTGWLAGQSAATTG